MENPSCCGYRDSGKKKGRAKRGPSKTPPLEKGQVIANCGGMNLDWSGLSLSAYFEALEAHNSAQGGKDGGKAPVDVERLNRFNRAHGVDI